MRIKVCINKELAGEGGWMLAILTAFRVDNLRDSDPPMTLHLGFLLAKAGAFADGHLARFCLH
jgi:hypothetical protein